jgi:putative transposase
VVIDNAVAGRVSVREAAEALGRSARHYNTVRLHSAIGYVTPQDMLAGRQAEIHAARDRKLEEARR